MTLTLTEIKRCNDAMMFFQNEVTKGMTDALIEQVANRKEQEPLLPFEDILAEERLKILVDTAFALSIGSKISLEKINSIMRESFQTVMSYADKMKTPSQRKG